MYNLGRFFLNYSLRVEIMCTRIMWISFNKDTLDAGMLNYSISLLNFACTKKKLRQRGLNLILKVG